MEAAGVGHAWAVGALGWWLVHAGRLSADDPHLAVAAAR